MGQQTSRHRREPEDLNKEIRICSSGNEGNYRYSGQQQRKNVKPSRTLNAIPSPRNYSESSRTIRIPPCLCKSSCACRPSKGVEEEQEAFNRLRDSLRSSMEIAMCTAPIKTDISKVNQGIASNNLSAQVFCCETSLEGSNEIEQITSKEIKICPSDTIRPCQIFPYGKLESNFPSSDFKEMPFRRRPSEACQELKASPRLSALSSVSTQQTIRSIHESQKIETSKENQYPNAVKVTSHIQIRQAQSRQPSIENSRRVSQYRESNLGVLYDRQRDSERNNNGNRWQRPSYEARDSRSGSIYDQQRHTSRESARVSYSNSYSPYESRRKSKYELNERKNTYGTENYGAVERDQRSHTHYDHHKQAPREAYSNVYGTHDTRRKSSHADELNRNTYERLNYGTLDSLSTIRHIVQSSLPTAIANDTHDSKRNFSHVDDLGRNTYGTQNYGALDSRSTKRHFVQSSLPNAMENDTHDSRRNSSHVEHIVQSALPTAMVNKTPRMSPSTSTFVRMPAREMSIPSRQLVGYASSPTKNTARTCIDCCAQTSGVFNEHVCTDVKTQTSVCDCTNIKIQTSEISSDCDYVDVITQTSAKLADFDCIDIINQTSARLITPSYIDVRIQTLAKLPIKTCADVGTVTSTDADCADVKTQTSRRLSRAIIRNDQTQPMTSFSRKSCYDAKTQTSANRVTDVFDATSIQSLHNQNVVELCPEVQIRQQKPNMPSTQDYKRQRQSREKELGVIYDRQRDGERENYKSKFATRGTQRQIYETRDSISSTFNDTSKRPSARESACLSWFSKQNGALDSRYDNIGRDHIRESCVPNPHELQRQEQRDFRRESYESARRERERERYSEMSHYRPPSPVRSSKSIKNPRFSYEKDPSIENYRAEDYGCNGHDHTNSPTNGAGTPVGYGNENYGASISNQENTARSSQREEIVTKNGARVSDTVSAAVYIEKEDESSSDEEKNEKPNLMLVQPVVVCYQQPQQPFCSYPYTTTTCCDYSCYSYGCDPCCQSICQPLSMSCYSPPPHINNCFSIDPSYCFGNNGIGNHHKKRHKKKSRYSRASR